MQRQFRLTGSKRFSTIRHEGQGWANRFLVLKVVSNDLPKNRIGFAVGKRIGVAVVRNKVKRRLREIAAVTQLRPGWDVLFIARRQSPNIHFQELKLATEDLLRRAGLLLPSDNPGSTLLKSTEQDRTPAPAQVGANRNLTVSSDLGGIKN